ncbi:MULTISPECIES: HNH endonuclease [Neisseria]|uniref:HNH endonuclease n=1 Tax=Neisseria TaxID=482 RepID=UPI0008A182A3|nr:MULTISPECIES: HNH endonuclease [Neisseria]OFQ12666.1 type II restriction endonuclease [Neisseria sp. HMSC068C12]OHQ09277.1 type II restriction endonuclease [Neisseria sp. HMSC064D07]
MSDKVIFKNKPNDDEYIKWIEENSNGFVLNIDQTKDPSKIYKDYPKIHFANCGQLNKRPGRTTKKYFKVCSNSIEELERWSLNTYNKELTPCRTCKKRGLLVAWYAEIKNLQAASALSLKSDIDELKECLVSETNSAKRTEIETLIKARQGQGSFRQKLLKLYPSCPLTGLDIEPLLIASHIKPWSVCDDNERLCRFNGLMLAPNIDRLFDNGLITFDTDGTIKISPTIDSENQKRLGISPDMKLKIRPESEKYFEYHRNHVFQKEE